MRSPLPTLPPARPALRTSGALHPWLVHPWQSMRSAPRRLPTIVRSIAIGAAILCALATAPAASARSVAGEYTPAATLITDAPVVFSETAPIPADAPLITPPPAPAPTPVAAPAPDPRQVAIATAIAAAESKLGAPYSYGSAGPNAFDCSGFTRWVYQQAGIVLPHFTGAQLALTTRIPLDQLQPGDLIFNWGFGGGAPDHVGLYVGDGMMIHAPNSGGSVRFDSIWWWTGASTAAGRLP